MGIMITVGDRQNDVSVEAYLAEPTGKPRGALILIHEIWGLVEHVKNVTDRFAAEGYLVLAPDLLSGVGITPEVGAELLRLRTSASQEEQTRLQPMMREKMAPLQSPEYAVWAVAALRGCLDHLSEQAGIGDRLAVLGFCFGGSYSFALAAADDRVKAAMPFYGAPPEGSDVAAISCPVLAFYGDQDERLISSLPEVRVAMAEAGVDFTAQVYAGVGHAFFNDSNPHAYDEAGATDAWQRSLDLLSRTLGVL